MIKEGDLVKHPDNAGFWADEVDRIGLVIESDYQKNEVPPSHLIMWSDGETSLAWSDDLKKITRQT